MRKLALFIITVASMSLQAQYNVYDDLDVYGNINGRKYINAEDSVTSNKLVGDTTQTNVLLLGGRESISYDTNNKLGQLNVFDENDETLLQVGYETWIPPSCYNGTASIILNGTPVYIDTTEQGYPSIAPADNRYYSKQAIGVATQDILAASYGTVTRFGIINGVQSMAGRESDDVFVGQNGGKVFVRPTGGKYPIRIGLALNDTTLLAFPSNAEYTDELIKAFGFPNYSNAYTTLSFNNTTRYFKISPTGTDFYHYQNGVKYLKSGSDSVLLPSTEGLYTIYYNNGALSYIYQANDAQLRDIYKTKVIVSQVYWDATNSKALFIGNQRHTFHIDPYIHEWAHFSFGAIYSDGIGITDITTNGDASLNTSAQFGIGSGSFHNEDILITTPSIPRGSSLPIYYVSGVLNLPRRIYQAGFPVLTDVTAGVGVTGRLVYNNITTGTLVTVTNNYYVFCHLFSLNNVTDSLKIFSVVGQSQYSSKAAAESAALVEGKNIKARAIPGREGVLLYTLIYETSSVYSNAVKARVVSTVDALGNTVDYVDWRNQFIGGGGAGGAVSGSFLDHSDTPNSYLGQANKLVSVNSGETALEFIPNVYKDSAGVASVVDNTAFVDLTTNSISVSGMVNSHLMLSDSANIKDFYADTATIDTASISKLNATTVKSTTVAASSISLNGDTRTAWPSAGAAEWYNSTKEWGFFNDTINLNWKHNNYDQSVVDADFVVKYYTHPDSVRNGNTALADFRGDGVHSVDFGKAKQLTGSFNYDNSVDIQNFTSFMFHDDFVFYNIYAQYIFDTTKPFLISAEVGSISNDTIMLTFSEPMTIDTVGWRVAINDTLKAIDTVINSGTAYPYIVLLNDTVVYDDTVKISYLGGNTEDINNNALLPLTDSSVTNNLIASLAKFIPTDQLLFWLPFNGNAFDMSGNKVEMLGNTNATLASDRFGNTYSSYYFDSTAYILYDENPIQIGLDDWSISFWTRADLNRYGKIVGSQYYYFNVISALYGRGYLTGSYSTGAGFISTTYSWKHVVVTYDRDGGMQLYINNAAVGGATNISALSGNDYQSLFYFCVGATNNNNVIRSEFFKGEIDDVAIYKKVLSTNAIDSLYNAP